MLEADRIDRLQELPGWAWDSFTGAWEEGFARLLDYVESNGDARVPRGCMVADYPLGDWVRRQRNIQSQGRLDADRKDRLQELPGWIWSTNTAAWEEGFARLQEYVESNGDARVPQGYMVDSFPLGVWVCNQRANYAKGTLEAGRKDRLQELGGWVWNTRTDQWEEGFARLLEYVESNDDACVPRDYKVDGYSLGSWVGTQRKNYANGMLEVGRARRLSKLRGWVWVNKIHTSAWEEGFARLQEYVKSNGDARVPVKYTTADGYLLGSWVCNQRTNYAKGTLDADRARRLSKLPGWAWNINTAAWEDGFARLLKYVKSNGDARVPGPYTIDGYPLGRWVKAQRADYARGTLDADRKDRLQELPGWIWSTNTAGWEEGFARLQEYVESNGDARVRNSYKVDGYALGLWVRNQRTSYAQGKLDANRADRLSKVTGWVWSTR